MPKRDLYFRTPIMNAAGTLGFAPDFRSLADFGNLSNELGAFVTNPISRRPRKPAAHPALIEYPGGFLLHTGLPNPGFEAAVRRYARRWADAPLPVIVHLMADRPEETARMTEALEGLENVMAAELGFAPLLADDVVLIALEMSLGELPLIVSLPMEDAVRLGPRVMEAGAAAVSLSARRGALTPVPSPDSGRGESALTSNPSSSGRGDAALTPNPSSSGRGELVTGRLYGPGLFPQSLETVRRLAGAGIPVIGAGGVYTREQIEIMLEAGAMAVQLDAVLWRGGF